MKRSSSLLRRSPLRRVSPKRAKADREYFIRKKRFLAEHPFCQWWLAENGFTEAAAIEAAKWGGWSWVIGDKGQSITVWGIPRSQVVHHKKKPRCKYLNDESTWMAVSIRGHKAIEDNLTLARQKGYAEY